jgi:hypothetical protein
MARKVQYLKSLDNTQANLVSLQINANQTIVDGDLIVISSGKGSKAGAAASAIFGIAKGAITTGGTVTADDAIPVMPINEKSVLRMGYSGSTNTSVDASEMYTTAYDITDTTQKVNLDDTTGGMMLIVGYDNTAKTVDVVVKKSALWNA